MAKTKMTISPNGSDPIEIDADKFLGRQHDDSLLKVTHATLVDETCTYSYSVRLENGDTDIMTNECGRQYHQDLRQAFRLFDGHLAVITEQVDADRVSEIDECVGNDKTITAKLSQVEVSDIVINGNIETGTVVLKGTKVLKSGDQINLKTPKQALDSDYAFCNELAVAVQNLIEEITAYHNGKSRPESQMNMFEGTEEAK